MKSLFQHIRLTLLCVVLFGMLYPGFIWLVGRGVPGTADGSPITYKGRTVGMQNVGQPFSDITYFWGRPSAVGYNAASTGGSNQGPTNPAHIQLVTERLSAFLAAHPYLKAYDVPSEMVTASGGGLDPNISPKAASIQVQRVAKERGMAEAKVRELVAAHTEGPLLGLFGPAKVNVLALNLALDGQK